MHIDQPLREGAPYDGRAQTRPAVSNRHRSICSMSLIPCAHGVTGSPPSSPRSPSVWRGLHLSASSWAACGRAKPARTATRTRTTCAKPGRTSRKRPGRPSMTAFFERENFVYDTEPACRAVVTIRHVYPQEALPFLTRLSSAFYAGNRDITQTDVLGDIAQEAGFNRAEFLAAFQSDAARDQTRQDFTMCQDAGIRGFPTLIGGNGPARSRRRGARLSPSHARLLRLGRHGGSAGAMGRGIGTPTSHAPLFSPREFEGPIWSLRELPHGEGPQPARALRIAHARSGAFFIRLNLQMLKWHEGSVEIASENPDRSSSSPRRRFPLRQVPRVPSADARCQKS